MNIIDDGWVAVFFEIFVGSSFFNFCKSRTLCGRVRWLRWPEWMGMAVLGASRTRFQYGYSSIEVRYGVEWLVSVKGKV